MTARELLNIYKEDSRVKDLAQYINSHKAARLHLKGLIGSADAFIAIAAYFILHRPAVFILPDREEALYFHGDLESLLGSQVLFFPSAYRKAFDFTQPDTANVLARAEVLNALKYDQGYGKLLVTYPEAIAEKVINRETLDENTLTITKGARLGIDFINEFLTDYNFTRVDFVYEPGQFSIRGGIVDIFSFAADNPFRVEFFGDEVESIRSFDIESQLSVTEVNELTVLPNVQAGFLNESNINLLEYIQADTQLWIKDVTFMFDVARQGYLKADELWQNISTADKESNPEWLPPGKAFSTETEISRLLAAFTVVEFGKQFLFSAAHTITFNNSPQPSFNKDFQLLVHNLHANTAKHIQNFIFTNAARQWERLYAILNDIDKSAAVTPVHIGLREGYIDGDLKKAFYTDHQIFDRYYKYNNKKGYQRSQALTLKELRDLKPGDYVTHIDHGIGKYAGLEKVDVNGRMQEMIRLVYADNDLLYVNINSLNRIAKYSGKEGTAPKINKLGTDAWDKLKKTTKKKVKDIARDLIKLYALRKAQEGTAFMPDTYLQTELEASFLYEDTPDQLKATADVKRDMEAPHPMDRLICGDVGFGKTEIAIRAAFKAVTDGKQVAVLVPTTILALQHYKTFKSRLHDMPVTVDYINRFKTNKQIKATLQDVAEGKTEIIIGTHRLLSKDVKFKDLGLMIVDEEQKFGVSSKEKLKAIKVNVDTLTLTATPIPRTLHFSLMGARDLSIISTPPPNRQPVTTELHVFNDKLIQEAVQFELDRGGQVFFIHNRVADLPQLGGLIQQLVPGARIGIAHGQLEGDALEDVMLDFINGEKDVLVATTIIEAGLDIPNANTIIINHAHMFGLSDLHQMRGRVGRSNKKAFCYLLSPPLSTLTSEARKRLSAIEEFSDLGSGFNVAMRDLDIRGSGNLLGAEQSGFISEIGFDMYHKILDEAIQELKDSEFKELFADQPEKPFVQFTQIDTDLEMFIPDSYVTNITERYNLYTEISSLETEDQLQQFSRHLHDRFGPIPPQVRTMLAVVHLQWLGKALGFEKITFKNNTLRAYFLSDKQSPYFDSETFKRIMDFAVSHPGICNLKEVKNSLRIAFTHVTGVQQAIDLLSQV